MTLQENSQRLANLINSLSLEDRNKIIDSIKARVAKRAIDIYNKDLDTMVLDILTQDLNNP
jgi:uncharacterized protein YjgD (DUF1641 family)